MRYFFGVLDIAAVNSFVLAKWNSGQDKFTSQAHNNFLKKLSLALVTPQMEKRLVNPHIGRTLRQEIAKILGKKMEPRALPQEPQAKKRKRCFLCDPAKDRKGNE